MTKIIIHPRLNLFYSAYYIQGLYEVYGKKNVCFANKKELQYFGNLGGENFCFIAIKDNRILIKVSIDFNDDNGIPQNRMVYYDWSDIYGKVNTNWKITPQLNYTKIVSLAPNFGIRVWNQYDATYYAFKNFSNLYPVTNWKRYFALYYLQKNKLYIGEYPLSEVQKNYVFCLNTLWHSTEQNRLNETTNKIRADFMEVCIGMSEIDFDGGFFQSQLGNDSYKHLQVPKPISQREYIKNLRKSIVVFNTPAVWSCHGWKLGEYLCMGKAIISTPLINDLPAPLIHGKHIHIVRGKEEYLEAVNEDDKYRQKLECGARDYYNDYVAPKQTINLLEIEKDRNK